MEKNQMQNPSASRGNGWVSCGIGSGKTKQEIWVCEKCGWQAEIFVWKPEACPSCGRTFQKIRAEQPG